MKEKGYKIIDWMFFFGKTEEVNLKKILSSVENKGLTEEFVTWKLLTVYLPLLTFLLVVFLNLVTNGWDINCFYTFVNNGSLPILSFGIITSGMPYLLEQLQEFPEYQSARRRVMALSMFILFLSASIYILQTLSVISMRFTNEVKLTILLVSIYVFFSACSIGYKMFLLQSKNIKEFAEELQDNVNGLKTSVADLD